MIRVCPARDAPCPHGMDCLYVGDGYECGDPTIREYRKHVERINRTTDREIEDSERRRSGGRVAVSTNDVKMTEMEMAAQEVRMNPDRGVSAPPSQEGLEDRLNEDAAYIESYSGFVGNPDYIAGNQRAAAAALSRLRAELGIEEIKREDAEDALAKANTRAAAAEATVTRLTEALTEIADHAYSRGGATDIARAALRKEPHEYSR